MYKSNTTTIATTTAHFARKAAATPAGMQHLCKTYFASNDHRKCKDSVCAEIKQKKMDDKHVFLILSAFRGISRGESFVARRVTFYEDIS